MNLSFILFSAGMKIQSVLTSAVYDKALKLSNAARRDKTIGEIVNLMAIDVERFQMITPQIQQYWSSPFQIILSLLLLYQTIGISVIGGVVVMLLLIPCNFAVSVAVKKWQAQQMMLKDERLKMTNEILGGIKVIKLYAWEPPMMKVINEIRTNEVNLIRRATLLRTIADIINVSSPFFVGLAKFISWTLPRSST